MNNKETAYIFSDTSGELLISHDKLEKAEQLLHEVAKSFPVPDTLSEEDKEKLYDALTKSIERIKDETNKVKPIINFDLSIPYTGEDNED